MFRKICLVIGFWALLAAPAYASWFGTSPLQKILTAQKMSVDGYDLSVDELNIFYSARDYRAAWDFTEQDSNVTLTNFLDSIDRLIEYHGLERGDYPIDLIKKLSLLTDEDSKNELELLVTDTILRLAHDLHGDMLDLDRIYTGWNFDRRETDIPNTLQIAVANNGLNDYIEILTPKNAAYTQLAQALRTYREMAAKGDWPKIDGGPMLRPKDHGPRIAQLRARLAAEGYGVQTSLPNRKNQFYDEDLQKVVLEYQSRNGLGVDGLIGGKVVDAFNTPITERIDQIRANMERWRHMPEDFPPERYALVNIPDASLVIYEDGKPMYQSVVIVGQVERKTPFIQSAIRSMIINPSWHVPTKIARKDILPKLRDDPHYLEKMGIVIRDNKDDPYGEDIDWDNMSASDFNFHLRQEPGDLNSLGRIKFDFNNDFAVYMHGTPHQELFKKNERTLSSGCVRLADPERVAEIVTSTNKEPWTIEKLEEQIQSEKTHWVGITQTLPVYFLYWTVFTDDAGQVNFRKDVYDYDTLLMQNMRGEETADDSKTTPASESSH